MHRGVASDDWRNATWAQLWNMLSKFRETADTLILSEGRIGNALETVVCLSYACFHRFQNLPRTHSLSYPRAEGTAEEAKALWTQAWSASQKLGVRVTRSSSSLSSGNCTSDAIT